MNKTKNMAERIHMRSKHRGEYVAWVGDKIVAHGENLRQVMEEAKKHEGRLVIDKVEKEGVRVV